MSDSATPITPNNDAILAATNADLATKAVEIAKGLHKEDDSIERVFGEKKEEPKMEAPDPAKQEVLKEEPKKEDKVEDKPKEEPKKEEKKEEPKDELADRVSSRFAALSRKEKAIRENEKQLEVRAAKIKEVENIVELAKTDPIGLLEKLGLSYEQITTAVLKGGKDVEIGKLSKMEKENQELKQQMTKIIEDNKKAEEQRKFTETEQKINEATSKFKSELKANLDKSVDKYELVSANPEGIEFIFNIIDQDFSDKKAKADAEGRELTLEAMMSFDEAAKIAEAYLDEQLSPYAKTKKFSNKIEPKAPESKPVVEVKKEAAPSSPSTLSNNLANAAPGTAKIMTRAEEIAVASETFKGKLFRD